MVRWLALATLCALCTPPAAMACGVSTDCTVATGTYRISLPDPSATPIAAVVFAHGYQGSAAGTMKNTALWDMATSRGMALIAIDALGDDWNLPDAPHDSVSSRDEMAYLDAVVADAVRQFNVDPKRVVVTGFSAGGMFVWNVVCARGDAYAGYVPYSGTFWKGPPAACPASAQNVIHIDGRARDCRNQAGQRASGIGDVRGGQRVRSGTRLCHGRHDLRACHERGGQAAGPVPVRRRPLVHGETAGGGAGPAVGGELTGVRTGTGLTKVLKRDP